MVAMRCAVAVAASAALLLTSFALAASTAQTVAAKDRTGDVEAAGVDIAGATMTRSAGDLVARISLAQQAADDVRYSAKVAVGTSRWSLEAIRSGGVSRFTAVREQPTAKRLAVHGSFVGRRVSIRVPAAALGATRAGFRLWFEAEVAGGGFYAEDRLPDDDRPLLARVSSPLARSLRFPAG